MTQQFPASLSELWASHDDRMLLKNPISIRLPVHLMAKITALSDVFPNKSRSEAMVFLMKLALETLERQAFAVDSPVSDDPEHDPIGSIIGEAYRKSANKHYRQLMKEVGGKHMADLFPVDGEGK